MSAADQIGKNPTPGPAGVVQLVLGFANAILTQNRKKQYKVDGKRVSKEQFGGGGGGNVLQQAAEAAARLARPVAAVSPPTATRPSDPGYRPDLTEPRLPPLKRTPSPPKPPPQGPSVADRPSLRVRVSGPKRRSASFFCLLIVLTAALLLPTLAAAQSDDEDAADNARHNQHDISTKSPSTQRSRRTSTYINTILMAGKFATGAAESDLRRLLQQFFPRTLDRAHKSHQPARLSKRIAHQSSRQEERSGKCPRPPERASARLHEEVGCGKLSSGHSDQCHADDRRSERHRATAHPAARGLKLFDCIGRQRQIAG